MLVARSSPPSSRTRRQTPVTCRDATDEAVEIPALNPDLLLPAGAPGPPPGSPAETAAPRAPASPESAAGGLVAQLGLLVVILS